MKRLYKGKTKDVYEIDDKYVLLQFKDDVTGDEGVFDPGANTVGLTVAGAGQSSVRMTVYFFKLLETQGIPTHFVEANTKEATMTVKHAHMLGNGLEVICRYRAVGSFFKRYGAYCEENQRLDGLVEMTIKDDHREDPPISKDTLQALNIINHEEYEQIKTLTKRICAIIKDEFAKKGLQLYDIKLEFGRDPQSGEIILIDEISGGNMRVFKDAEPVAPLDLEKILFDS